MRKNCFFLALAMVLFAGTGYAQAPCATDEMHKEYIKQHPEIAEYEKQINAGVASFIAAHSNPGKVASKTTAVHNDTDYYDIPVVVHIIHNYGTEFVKDSNIYALINEMNKFYNMENNLTPIIQPFKKYIGNAKIRFHLATIDPLGHPSKGITRRFSYLTYGGDDQAKLDMWPPRNYFNIWFENVIGRGLTTGIVLAYATLPAGAESFPFNDGIISRADRINDLNTLQHEAGHYFGLYHPWNSGTGVGEVCGDDEVDDTPPTKGHFSVCGLTQLYDTTCAINYFKLYARASGIADSLANYPDTTNTQNIMDYSDCPNNMVTKGQVWRMRGVLNSDAGGRNNLWDSANLAMTGGLAPLPDLAPVPEWISRQAISATAPISFFTYVGANLYFTNKSWQDTVTEVAWTFTNGATKPNPTFNTATGLNNSFDNSFSTPGWVDITLAATGNNSGTTTTTFPKAVFVADNEGVNALGGYLEEFNEGGSRDKWPMFNYYNNSLKWKLADVGVYDNSSVMYQGFDVRTGLDLLKGTPKGDFDDLYSVPFDLTGLVSGECNLNFHYSSASRTSSDTSITDSLYIDYSVNKGQSWNKVTILGKSGLINQGASSTAYTPTSITQWSAKTISIPAAARTAYTVFRFRYKPGVIVGGTISTGNNFYMDRVHISPWPAEVSDVIMGNADIKVLPNPTNGDAYVIVKDATSNKADVVVTDITGRVVYTTTHQLSGNATRILIPQAAIATKGIYLIQTSTGNQTKTGKLVVY